MIAIKQAVSEALLYFVWQGLAVAFLLWIVLFALRNRSANARYLASCAALLCVTALPVITALVLYQGPGASITGGVVADAGFEATSYSPAKWFASIEAWALPLWSFGVVIFSSRLIWGCWQVVLLRRQGTAADGTVLATVARLRDRMGLTNSVRVMISDASDGPSVIGWIRPVILLPAATVLGLSPEQLEAVLAHECAHIRRYDYLVNLLQSLVETMLFYHPAVWWISGRMRHERELCCDDLAVRVCGDVLCYARALTTLEGLRVRSLALGASDGSVLYRVQRLLGAVDRQKRSSAVPAFLALCLGLACFAVTINMARGQAVPAMAEERGVSVNLTGGTLLRRTAVFYPRAALEKKIAGVVVVAATLDGAGDVSDARVISGPMELRKAALESVLKWQFTPGAAQGTVSVAFQLPPDEIGPASADSTREFLRQEYDTARRNADALSFKLKIAEVDGRTLKAIHIDVASGEVRALVVSHLSAVGARVGDTLSPAMIGRIAAAVRQVDDRLRVIPATAEDNQAIIRITE